MDSNVKRVKFTFYRLKSDRDEWVEVGSPRIAPHHSYTPRPFIGGTSSKKGDTSAGAKRKVDDVESQEDGDAKSLVALSAKPINDYLNTWLALHAANPIPDSEQKLKIMSDTGLSESQLDDWMRTRKKPKKKKDDGLTDEQRKEKELKKKLNEEMNNFLSAWLLRPENVHSNPIAAATPTTEAKEWMAKHLGVDRARIDSWFYRRRRKLKSQHMPETVFQAPNQTIAATGNIPQPHPQNQAVPVSATSIVKPPSAPQNQHTINPNVNLPSNNQRPQNQIALTSSTQVSVSVNQQLPSNGQSQVAVGGSISTGAIPQPPTSTVAIPSKQCGLSEDAKQYLTQWLLKTSNPYPSKEMKDKIMAHFGVTNTRTLDGFLTRTRKKLNLQNKQSFIHPAQQPASSATTHPGLSSQMIQSQPAMMTVASRPGGSVQTKQPQPANASRITQPNYPSQPTQALVASRIAQPTQPTQIPSVSLATRPGESVLTKQSQPANASRITQPNYPSQPTQAPVASRIAQPTQPPSGLSAQLKSTQNVTINNFQPSSSALPIQNTSLSSLLTAVELVNSQKQYTEPQPSHQRASDRIGLAPPAPAMGSASSQNQHQQHNQHPQQHPSPMETGNPSRQQPYQPAPTREQSIMTAYQNLQEMEIHDRSSSRSSPAEAAVRPMQSSDNNTAAHGSQANRENQQQASRDIQQQYIHGQNPNK